MNLTFLKLFYYCGAHVHPIFAIIFVLSTRMIDTNEELLYGMSDLMIALSSEQPCLERKRPVGQQQKILPFL